MAATALVNKDLEIGRRILGALRKVQIQVRVALWAYAPQISEWQLFIATSLVDSRGHKAAYELVLRTLHDAGLDPELPWRRIFLRSPKDPVLKFLDKEMSSYRGSIEIMESENIPRGTPSSYYVTYAGYPGETFRVLNANVGDRFVEDAYVYGATWSVTGLDHLRKLLSRLHIHRSDIELALEQIIAHKKALISDVTVQARDLRRLQPA